MTTDEFGRWRGEAALVSALLPAVPSDEFTGEPYVYRRVAEDYVLYSVGPNGRDDGGVGDARPGKADDVVGRAAR